MSLIRLSWPGAVVLAAMLGFGTVNAEQVLVSEQSNYTLRLRGPVFVSGNAPFPLQELPHGEYRVQTKGPGTPTARGRFIRDTNGISSRPWAGSSSLIYPPGFMHLKRGESRGLVFLSTGALSTTMAIIKHGDVKNADDNLQRAQFLYDRASDVSNISEARANLVIAGLEQRDAEDIRDLWRMYSAAIWVGAAAEAWLLTPNPTLRSQGQDQFVVGVQPASSWKAAFRSALVPGAGQRYMGNGGRAGLFTITFGAAAAATIFAQDAYRDAYRDQARVQLLYNQAESEGDISRLARDLEKAASKTDDRSIFRYAMAGITGGIYLWNVIDAYSLGGQSGTSDVNLSLLPNPDGFSAQLRWSIQ